MKALNVLLAVLMSLLVAAAVLEGGLRLLGMGPQPTINRFDPKLGWVKTPGTTTHRKTSEFDITFAVNSLGLRDDEMASAAKPAGTYRVIALGDSFVLGYTVDRQDLFVDELEKAWQSEGRPVDVINAGTEGYSTDQEVLWLDLHGRAFQPDLVLLFPYENDLYWSAKASYGRYPKPRFDVLGAPEHLVLADPGPPPWQDRFALGRILAALGKRPPMWTPPGGRPLSMEWVAYFKDSPEPMHEVRLRTRSALSHLKKACEEVGAKLVVVPIPNKACIEADARQRLAKQIQVATEAWSPDLPVETFLRLCGELSIAALDPRESLRAAAASVEDGRLYFQKDWHLNPEGNRALANFVRAELDRIQVLPAPVAGSKPVEIPAPVKVHSFGWLKIFALLWAVLSCVWILTYPQDRAWQAPLKVLVMLGLVFTIILGGNWVLGKIPAAFSQWILVAFVLGLFGFIFWKLGRRLGTIVELFACMVGRGHWYLIPLVVVLLSVGSLLVVAASSPLVAPFIYTLF
ncbi:MAG: DUF5989 family protein [Planctomycetota bacterium]